MPSAKIISSTPSLFNFTKQYYITILFCLMILFNFTFLISLKLQRSGFQISHFHRMKGLPGRAYQDIKSHFSSPTNTDIFELKHSFKHSNSYRHDPCHTGLAIQNIGKILQSGVCPASCAFQQMHVIFI